MAKAVTTRREKKWNKNKFRRERKSSNASQLSWALKGSVKKRRKSTGWMIETLAPHRPKADSADCAVWNRPRNRNHRHEWNSLRDLTWPIPKYEANVTFHQTKKKHPLSASLPKMMRFRSVRKKPTSPARPSNSQWSKKSATRLQPYFQSLVSS